MRFLRTQRFKKDFKHLPDSVQRRFFEALGKFSLDPRHPSLHAKKMEGAGGIWEMRLSNNYRVTFEFVKQDILLRRVGTHNTLRQP